MILTVTGHRPDKLGGYQIMPLLTKFAVNRLQYYQPDKVISGMALGWDMAIASAAIMLEIPLIAAVPFKGLESKWPERSQIYYRRLLASASKVKIVSKGKYEPWKMQKRNEWMVDEGDLLLALWDGSKGGTANCIEYAEDRIEIKNCWNTWMKFKRRNK